jgi:CheY-like chemotaxis protein
MPKILLVEDNEDNRDMLSRRLIRKGYDVSMAVDGAEGVAKAQAERPDIILMDMSLPVMDGWEATRQVKGNALTATIPVIALTRSCDGGRPRKSGRSGLRRLRYETGRPSAPACKIEALLGIQEGRDGCNSSTRRIVVGAAP